MTKLPPTTTARMKLAELLPADYNPRTIGDAERRALRKSLETFGQATTLTWNRRTGRLVGGHQRAANLAAIGETEADVTIVDLDEAREKQLNIALNNEALAGRFDPTKLEGLLHEIQLSDPGAFDALRFGEIDNVLDDQASRAAVDGIKERIEQAKPHKEVGDLATEMAQAISTKILKLAATDPKRLLAAVAVVVPSRRGTDCLVLADPNTHDAAVELRRLAEAGHPSPVEALMEAIAPMSPAKPCEQPSK